MRLKQGVCQGVQSACQEQNGHKVVCWSFAKKVNKCRTGLYCLRDSNSRSLTQSTNQPLYSTKKSETPLSLQVYVVLMWYKGTALYTAKIAQPV